jgi:tagatose 6-phosphate kinase
MILTVTLNPLLERRLTYKHASFTTGNRNGKLVLKAGGKGINVSRQLSKLNIKNATLTFAGGTNGKLFKDELKKEGIAHSIIQTQTETRECSVILVESSKKAVSFFSENNFVSSTEVDNFISQMEKMISNCEMVIFSGSSPCKETDIIFTAGIEMANKLGKISLCDTYGKHLENCLNASPTLIHNNVEETESLLGVSVKTEKETISYLDSLYSKGIKQAFITNGDEDFYCSNFDFHYKVSLPKITAVDSTGSGDAFVAGIIYGWVNRLTFNEQVSFAASLGISNALSFDVCNYEFDNPKAFIEKINIEPVGKKIKIIDDSPR